MQGKAEGAVKEYVTSKGLAQISDPEQIGAMIDSIIESHPDQLQQFRSGKTKVQGFFQGCAPLNLGMNGILMPCFLKDQLVSHTFLIESKVGLLCQG